MKLKDINISGPFNADKDIVAIEAPKTELDTDYISSDFNISHKFDDSYK